MIAEAQEAPKPTVVWEPLPGSQQLAVTCPCNELLYEGTRGPGKTDAQLMYFRRNVGIGYGRFWRGVIFDREYKNLDDLISKSQRWFPQFMDGAKFLSSRGDYKWVWPTGEELLFRQIKKGVDYWNYHGQEFPFIGWNELSKFPTAELYDAMKSCNRSSFLPESHSPNPFQPLPEIPLVIFSTTNPYGAGHGWVKKRFIDPAPPGVIQKTEFEVFNPRTQKRETIVKTRVRLFGSYKENKYLSPEYIADLESIRDPNKRRAWLWGDWDIVAGGALDDVWDESVHIKPPFKIPSSWRLDRAFDWGSTHPFAVTWWAESDGTEADLPDGTKFCPPKGTLVLYDEWYGTEEPGTNRGLKMSAKDVATGIKEHEELMRQKEIAVNRIWSGPADSQIYQVREKEVDTIAKKMLDEGIEWVPADKSPGSRINGLQLVRDRFENSLRGEGPGIYITANCIHTKATVPVLPRDDDLPDDVDTDAEDHLYDTIRYRVLAGQNRYATTIKVRYG